jgi:hypothetical protein
MTRMDQILFRFRVNGTGWAVRFREGDPDVFDDKVWSLYNDQGHLITGRGDMGSWGPVWTEPVSYAELAALYSVGHTSIRRLADKYIRLAAGNEGLHREIQRQVFVDVLSALGDDSVEIFDRLAASRVVTVTPGERLLDAVTQAQGLVTHLITMATGEHEADLATLAQSTLALLENAALIRIQTEQDEVARDGAYEETFGDGFGVDNPQEAR